MGDRKGNPKGVNADDACGKNVAVQKGTTQHEDDMPKRQAMQVRRQAGDQVVSDEDQDQATAALGPARPTRCWPTPRSCVRDQPVQRRARELGDIYDAAPYGYVLPKAETAFAQAIADALKALNTDGTYEAPAKWDNDSGAITDFAVNP